MRFIKKKGEVRGKKCSPIRARVSIFNDEIGLFIKRLISINIDLAIKHKNYEQL